MSDRKDGPSAPDLAAMRREYASAELREEGLHPDPIEQFNIWFQQACSAQLLEPNAMSLATCSADARPSLRTVLLKSFDARGFVFFTSFHSRKAREIEANPHVALMFPWLALERQVIVTGNARRISTAESLRYFLTRPRGSQISAWISQQSSAITSRKLLEIQWDQMKRKFADGDVPLPSFWGGFRVEPLTIEFWQGRPSRLHDRVLYTKHAQGHWTLARLAP
jgi:pyridoxamine 5'-phosphate oxidase